MRNPLPWALGAGAVFFLAVLLFWPRPPKRMVTETAALRAHRDLRTQDCSSPLVVSQILRRYLVAVFPLPGFGATTEEIIEALAESLPDDPVMAQEIADFLVACDTAKFAPDFYATPASNAANALAWIEKIESRRRPAAAALSS